MGPVPAELPFPRDSVSWKVAGEPVLGVAGQSTLLLQVCHPLVAAGVAQYSDFEQDPWGRLWRTLDITLKLAFAEPKVSRRMQNVFHKMHERVKGVSGEGVAYHAMDPKLLLWVWATLVYGALDTYERVFGRLTDAERERFYAEQKVLAYATGIPAGTPPETFAEFRAYFERMVREELEPTEVARNVIAVSVRPPLPWPLRPLAGRTNAAALGFLPAELRAKLVAAGFMSWGPAHERAFRRLIAMLRVVGRVTPRPVRTLPTKYLIRREHPLRLFQRFSPAAKESPTKLAS